MNDLGNIYLQEIMHLDYAEVPKRLIKYRLPPKDEILESITDTNDFGDLYLEMKKRKHVNTMRIKQMVKDKPIEEIIDMMDPESSSYGKNFSKTKNNKKDKDFKSISTNFKTISNQTNQNRNNRYMVSREEKRSNATKQSG